jgi:hypothetical protein
MRRAALLLTSLALSGCASHYYVGYNYVDEGTKALNNVSRKIDPEMGAIEDKIGEALGVADIGTLRPIFAPKFAAAMTDSAISEFNEAVKAYKLSGRFERSKIGDRMPQGLPDFGDNFRIYDFIESQLILDGSPGAGLKFFVTKIDGTPKLCGLYLIDKAPGPSKKKYVGALAPETFDKFGLFGKPKWGTYYAPVK